MGSESSCDCDPLKTVIQNYLLSATNSGNKSSLEIKSRLHLFYKSSVIRLVERGGDRLLCRINEDAFSCSKECLDLEEIPISSRLLPDDKLVESVQNDEFGSVTIELNRDLMKEQVIKWVVSKGWKKYATNPCHNYLYKAEIMIARGSAPESLSEYRKLLVAQSISTLLKKVGHQVDDTQYSLVTNGNLPQNCLLVGGVPLEESNENLAVLLADLGTTTAKGIQDVQDILSKRLLEIKEISESRRLESLLLSSWATSLDNLTRATLHYELLYRPLETDVQLGSLSETGHLNHSALLIMYNYSRVLSILRRFSEQVETGEYPKLPRITDVDFSRICEREEELRLVQLLMEWPRVMESAVNFLRFHLNLVIVPKYLLALSKAFNNFYFQVVVLVPTNASHNFSTMMARVYLMQAICRVFEDCFDILQISHANSMSTVEN